MKSIKIISCNVISEMWYADYIYCVYKVKSQYKEYYELFLKNKIVFKKDAIHHNKNTI